MANDGVNTGYSLGLYPVDTYSRYFGRVSKYVTSSVALSTNVPYKNVDTTISAAAQTDTPNGVVVQLYKPGGAATGSEQGDVANGSITSTENDGTCLAIVTESNSPHVTFQGVVAYTQTQDTSSLVWYPKLKFRAGDRFSYDTTNNVLVYDPVVGKFEFVSYVAKPAFAGDQASPYCSIVVRVNTLTYAGTEKSATYDASDAAGILAVSGKVSKFDFTNASVATFTLPDSSSVSSDTVVVAYKKSGAGGVTIAVGGTSKKAYTTIGGTVEITGSLGTTAGFYVVLVPVKGGDWAAIASKLS